MTALTNLYHLHCFKCDECGKTLEKGDEFMLKDDRLFCKNDFQANQADGESDADSSLGKIFFILKLGCSHIVKSHKEPSFQEISLLIVLK